MKNKVLWISLSVLLVLIIVFLIVKAKKSNVENAENTVSEELSSIEKVTEETKTTTPTKRKKVSPALISYNEALVKYKDKRIQFDDSCVAVPNYVTYKDNTEIMLDNRSAYDRTIKLDASYSIKAYGFKIVKLPEISTPMTILVDCGNKQNVATILVQE